MHREQLNQATPSLTNVGLVGLALVSVTVTGCFRGEFLNRTCEELGNCDVGTTTGATSSTSGSTSTSGDTDPGTTTELGDDVLAFRLNTIEMVDPGIYAMIPGCENILPILNVAVLGPELDKGEVNVAMLFPDYDADAENGEIIVQRVQCDVPEKMCYRDGPSIYGFFGNNYASSCLEIPVDAIDPDNLLNLNDPSAPCFLSLEGTIYIDIVETVGQIQMRNARIAATYDDPQNPQSLTSGVMRGFVTEEQARMIDFDYGGITASVWEMVHSGESCLGAVPPYDTEFEMIDGEMTNGFWLYLNFTGERVSWTPLAKPEDPTTGGDMTTGDPTDGSTTMMMTTGMEMATTGP